MNTANIADKNQAADTAVSEWFDGYFSRVYGVALEQSHETDGSEHPNLRSDDFAARLNARFSEIDLAPRDGEITLFEIERALTNPLLHFDEKDMQMLKLLRRYFFLLTELHRERAGLPLMSITRADVELLTKCLTAASEKLRKRLEEEFSES